jgi:spermidine synthase
MASPVDLVCDNPNVVPKRQNFQEQTATDGAPYNVSLSLHRAIVAGMLLQRCSCYSITLIIGLGSGALPMFWPHQCELERTVTVEVDPAMVLCKEAHFNLSDELTCHVMDGLSI